MADSNLTTGTSGGTQNGTDNPQSATPYNGSSSNSASVQPGTNSQTLTSTGGIPLVNSAVPSLSLTTGTTQTTAAPTPPARSNHLLEGISIVLFIVAAVLFIGTFRSTKTQQIS